MPDEAVSTAPATAPAATSQAPASTGTPATPAAAPGQPAQPQNQPQHDPAYVTRLQQQVAGMNDWIGVTQAAKAAGITPAQVLERLTGTGTPAPQQTNQQQPADLAAVEARILSRMDLRTATTEHERGTQSESALRDQAIKMIAGDAPEGDPIRQMAEDIVFAAAEKNRPTYPAGHPLANSRFATYNEASWNKDVLPKLQAFQQIVKGGAMRLLANATRTQAPATSAGANGQQGSPATTPPKPFARMSPAERTAAAEAKYADPRTGQPISALGAR